MNVTRKDIAAAAGVSASTVGMILSGAGERYHAETRRRVFETAERLGYRRNLSAKALALRRSLLIGVLFSEVNTIHAPGFLLGLQEALAPTDYSPLVFLTRNEAEQQNGLDHCLSRRVDALLVNCAVDGSPGRLGPFASKVAALPVPVLEFFGEFLPGVAKVNIDNRHTGRVAVAHLRELGHRRIALMTHSRYQDRAMHRDACDMALGYHDAMAEAALEPRVLAMDFDYAKLSSSDFVNAGDHCLALMEAAPPLPTAVICYSDLMAYGLNRACRSRGLRVPADLSILGNANLMFSEVVNPPLSSSRFDAFEVGLEGARRLLAAIDGAPLEGVEVKPEIVARQSTGPVRSPDRERP